MSRTRPRVPQSWVVRPISSDDLPSMLELADSLGPGMTTLPPDREALAAKIEASVASFGGQAERIEAQYLLVLEDTDSGVLLGTAGVYPQVGVPYGFFSYKRLRQIQRSTGLGTGFEIDLLALANDYTGVTEVGTLSVRPEVRGTGAGRLLARSRYMLVAAFPQLFSPILMAEMRGWQDEGGRSPFWDCVGARFFNMDFATADKVSAIRGSDFISELLPKHPIYVNLLNKEAREAIGRPHRNSAPAMALLVEEGFRYEGYVDVFDAGPQLYCHRDQLATVRRSHKAILAHGGKDDADPHLIACGHLNHFCVTITACEATDGVLHANGRLPSAFATGAPIHFCPF